MSLMGPFVQIIKFKFIVQVHGLDQNFMAMLEFLYNSSYSLCPAIAIIWECHLYQGFSTSCFICCFYQYFHSFGNILVCSTQS